MFEFKKACDAFEKLSAAERGILLAEKSATIFKKLNNLYILGINPIDVLAGFIIGSVTADGKIKETEYLLIYPTLVKAFGADFDFKSVKEMFEYNKNGKKIIADYTEKMICILGALDENLKWDVIMLCFCVISIDGKISVKEKRYIKHLCETI